MHILWSKQPPYTWSFLWNLNFFSVFLLLFFAYFKLICFWLSRPNFFVEGDEGGIFSKAPDWKPLLLLKIKIKQNPRCPNRKLHEIFEHIHQNISTYPRSRKMYWSMIGKILLHTGKTLSKARCRRISAVCSRWYCAV